MLQTWDRAFEDFPVGRRFVSASRRFPQRKSSSSRAFTIRSRFISLLIPGKICSAAWPRVAGRRRRSRCGSSSKRCRSKGASSAGRSTNCAGRRRSIRRSHPGRDRNSRGAPFPIKTRLRPHPLSQPDEKPGGPGRAKLRRARPPTEVPPAKTMTMSHGPRNQQLRPEVAHRNEVQQSKNEWAVRGSNPRPTRCKRAALPLS